MLDHNDSARLAVIEEVVTRLEHRLFGNGQPGELSAIKSRISTLEEWRWYVMGGAFVAGGIVVYVFK